MKISIDVVAAGGRGGKILKKKNKKNLNDRDLKMKTAGYRRSCIIRKYYDTKNNITILIIICYLWSRRTATDARTR